MLASPFRWLILISVALLACHPIAPSDTCKQQISACLARCNPEPDSPDRVVVAAKGQHTPNTMSTCEQICMSCSVPKVSTSGAPSATPTGASQPIPEGVVSLPDGALSKTAPDAGVSPEAAP
jgi:hypothetical protein